MLQQAIKELDHIYKFFFINNEEKKVNVQEAESNFNHLLIMK